MKFQIKHECRGRIRVQAMQQRMTLEQADMLEAWLLTLPRWSGRLSMSGPAAR